MGPCYFPPPPQLLSNPPPIPGGVFGVVLKRRDMAYWSCALSSLLLPFLPLAVPRREREEWAKGEQGL